MRIGAKEQSISAKDQDVGRLRALGLGPGAKGARGTKNPKP